MAENNTTLRQALNRVEIIGYLKKIELEKAAGDDGAPYIRGSLTIMTGENSEHRIDVRANAQTKDGNASRAFAGLETVMAEYVSMAKLMEQGKTLEEAMAECDRVSVSRGQLSRSEYPDRDGKELISRRSVSSNFFNRVDLTEGFESKADFDCECYILSIKSEFLDGEDTGRKLVSVLIPIYGGRVIPFEFVVGKDLIKENLDKISIRNDEGAKP